ncbi:putative ATP-binding cassette transporter [Azospirillum fermentarium]|uniref:cyclic peptide export ABC transporter n=1 Tax=Azospirillum fermentarium TaxID=1233114 RepID=UPI0022275CFB|nr:cyclic peptide export ABC transporter [Azospirillum fermentarium]MCW2248530.1 putative ATP-binding cassette transporter [Azospirillum fermentarium]
MEFLHLLRSEAVPNLRRILMMATVAGLSNALVLALINAAANLDKDERGSITTLGLLFIIVVGTYTVAQRFVMSSTAREVERIIHRIRCRLIREIRNCELDGMERIGRTSIFNGLSKEIQTIAQSGNMLGMLFQNGVLLVFATLYLILVSLPAFVLTLVFTAGATSLYLARMARINTAIHEATQAEYRLHDLLGGILDGFKEIKLNDRRSAESAADVIQASLNAADERTKAQSEFGRTFVFTQNVFFLLLGTVVFLVPMLSDTPSDSLVKATSAVLFLFGPLAAVVSSIPILASANAAAGAIAELETLLRKTAENGRKVGRSTDAAAEPPAFQEIELRDVTFCFDDGQRERPFQVGPINLTLKPGETVFISGGNGAGKSTFMRLLTSLYWPQGGMILLDGQLLEHHAVHKYRALFSTVFSDYHLFKRLYGIDEEARARAEALIAEFELSDKTSLTGNELSTVDLSAGQRKRLALIVAMMERRPICVLDEWAADQDPYFRRKFYEDVIPKMKAAGTTVICVTHDDRYFGLADRRIHLEEGRIVMDSRETPDA